MHLVSRIAAGALALSGLALAAPASPHSSLLTRQETIECRCEFDECFYGDQLTEDNYIDYLNQYYPATDHYILYTAGSENQAVNFVQTNADYFYYGDFFDAFKSAHYLTQWPAKEDSQGRGVCYRPDDADAASVAIARAARTEIRVFGGVEYLTKGQTSWFATKEVPELRTNIENKLLNKITHMQNGATKPDEVLATEDADMNISYLDGQSGPNASGTFGDCSSTTEAPTCDSPGNDAALHEE